MILEECDQIKNPNCWDNTNSTDTANALRIATDAREFDTATAEAATVGTSTSVVIQFDLRVEGEAVSQSVADALTAQVAETSSVDFKT